VSIILINIQIWDLFVLFYILTLQNIFYFDSQVLYCIFCFYLLEF